MIMIWKSHQDIRYLRALSLSFLCLLWFPWLEGRHYCQYTSYKRLPNSLASIPQRRRSCRYEESLDSRKEKWSIASVSDKEFVLHVQGAELSVLPKRGFLVRQRQQVPVLGEYNNDLAIRDQSILKPSFKPTYTCSSQKLSFDWCSWRNSHQKPIAWWCRNSYSKLKKGFRG